MEPTTSTDAATAPAVDTSTHRPDGQPLRIAVIDDDPGIRTLLELSIELDPRYVFVAAHGTVTDALDTLRTTASTPLDAVLLDMSLPDMDGVTAITEVRRCAPRTRIAIFTGWQDDALTQRAHAAGADAVYLKDGDPSALLNHVAALCAAPTREPGAPAPSMPHR